MDKAIYFADYGPRENEFDVLSKNEDGTVDLGVDGVLVLGSVKVTESEVIGQCIVISDSTAPAKKQAKTKD